jgi:hypothetical protein
MFNVLGDGSAESLGIRADPAAESQRTRARDVLRKPTHRRTTVRQSGRPTTRAGTKAA